jgi:hypothetical protein
VRYCRIPRLISCFFVTLLLVPSLALAQLNAALLPDSISVGISNKASYFVTMSNSFANEVQNCTLQPGPNSPAGLQFDFQTTDVNNALTGVQNAPFNIAPGSSQTLAIFLEMNAPFSGRIRPDYQCAGPSPVQATLFPGVNDLGLTVNNGPAPDIIMIGTTLTADGIARTDMNARLAVQSLAATNIGIDANNVELVFDVTGFDTFRHLNVFGCETDPAGACITAFGNPLMFNFGAGETRTFSIFVETPPNYAIPLAPDRIRFRARFRIIDPNLPQNPELIFGATSVTIAAPDGLPPVLPNGLYEVRGRLNNDAQNQKPLKGIASFDPDGDVDIFTDHARPESQKDALTLIAFDIDQDGEIDSEVFDNPTKPLILDGFDLPALRAGPVPGAPQGTTILVFDLPGTPLSHTPLDVPAIITFGPGGARLDWPAALDPDDPDSNLFKDAGGVLMVPEIVDPGFPTFDPGTQRNEIADAMAGVFVPQPPGQNFNGTVPPGQFEVDLKTPLDNANGFDPWSVVMPGASSGAFSDPTPFVITPDDGLLNPFLFNPPVPPGLGSDFFFLLPNSGPSGLPIPPDVDLNGLELIHQAIIPRTFQSGGKMDKVAIIVIDNNRRGAAYGAKRKTGQ